MNVVVVGDVVAVVLERRRTEREQPYRGDAEVLKVVEFLGQAGKIANAVHDTVKEGFDVQFINDGVFVPKGVSFGGDGHWAFSASLESNKDAREGETV